MGRTLLHYLAFLEIVIWSSDYFENNLEIKHGMAKYFRRVDGMALINISALSILQKMLLLQKMSQEDGSFD